MHLVLQEPYMKRHITMAFEILCFVLKKKREMHDQPLINAIQTEPQRLKKVISFFLILLKGRCHEINIEHKRYGWLESNASRSSDSFLTLVLTALFIYFISLPKVTYGLSFKVICDLWP